MNTQTDTWRDKTDRDSEGQRLRLLYSHQDHKCCCHFILFFKTRPDITSLHIGSFLQIKIEVLSIIF